MRDRRRREFVRLLVGGAAGLTLRPGWVFGQGQPAPPIVVTKLTDRVAVLSGDGGNVALLIGPDSLIQVDGGLAGRAAELAAAVKDLDGRRVQVLFNTHYHFDHVGSNERLGAEAPGDVRIVAHQNVRARLAERQINEAFGRTFEPLAESGLPTETFTRGGRLPFGNEVLEYTYVPRAHTDGDSYVFLPGSNILHTGDLFWVGRYPVVDYSTGGSLAGMISALTRLDNVGDAATRIIPGHGPVSSKTEMAEIRAAWSTINERIEAMARQGRPVEDVIAAVPTKEFDGRFGVATRDGFIRQAFGGATMRLVQ
jgi:glyoxylase-like metal-dependent hydrolase (beta-lactamase superfamily II)